MRYYPVNLDVKDQQCLVVGGGGVGTRKVKTLLDCGAIVTVVSMDFTPELMKLAENHKIAIEKRSYRSTDLNDKFLVIVATDDEALNRKIYAEAQKQNKLCNIADFPEACNFILPSIVHRGDLVIAISTSGKSPAFAKKLRKDLEGQFGEAYADFLRLMGAVREKLLQEDHAPEQHKDTFEALIDSGLYEMIEKDRKEDIDRLLQRILGDAYTYERLMSA